MSATSVILNMLYLLWLCANSSRSAAAFQVASEQGFKKMICTCWDGKEMISICFLVVFISWGALLLEGWLFFRKRQFIKMRWRVEAWSCNLAGRKGAGERASCLKRCRIPIRKCAEHADDCKKCIRLWTRHAFNQGEFLGGFWSCFITTFYAHSVQMKMRVLEKSTHV